MASVIVLNGTSSSGKTTVARAFQELAPQLFLNFSIDTILYALPPDALDRVKRGADIPDLPLPGLVRGFYACVRELLALGHNLVIDHAVTAPYHAELLRAAIAGHDALLVGLDCPADVLRRRETDRGDRRPGLAEQQRSRVHSLLTYDLFFDTSELGAEEIARRILEAMMRLKSVP
jgi:chloramphenicol 3-O phosphotransferase